MFSIKTKSVAINDATGWKFAKWRDFKVLKHVSYTQTGKVARKEQSYAGEKPVPPKKTTCTAANLSSFSDIRSII